MAMFVYQRVSYWLSFSILSHVDEATLTKGAQFWVFEQIIGPIRRRLITLKWCFFGAKESPPPMPWSFRSWIFLVICPDGFGWTHFDIQKTPHLFIDTKNDHPRLDIWFMDHHGWVLLINFNASTMNKQDNLFRCWGWFFFWGGVTCMCCICVCIYYIYTTPAGSKNLTHNRLGKKIPQPIQLKRLRWGGTYKVVHRHQFFRVFGPLMVVIMDYNPA